MFLSSIFSLYNFNSNLFGVKQCEGGKMRLWCYAFLFLMICFLAKSFGPRLREI